MPRQTNQHADPVARIVAVLLVMVCIGAFSAFVQSANNIQQRRITGLAACQKPASCVSERQVAMRSAQAAEDIVDLTIIQMAIGAVGLALVGWTLQATRAAVKEASEATKSSRTTVKLAQEALHTENRAWVNIEPVLSSDVITWRDDAVNFSIDVTATNGGSTPALRVGLHCHSTNKIRTDLDEEWITFIQRLRDPRSSIIPRIVFSEEQISLNHRLSPTVRGTELEEYGMASVTVFVAASYHTVFDDPKAQMHITARVYNLLEGGNRSIVKERCPLRAIDVGLIPSTFEPGLLD